MFYVIDIKPENAGKYTSELLSQLQGKICASVEFKDGQAKITTKENIYVEHLGTAPVNAWGLFTEDVRPATYKDFKSASEKETNAFTKKYCFWAFGSDQLSEKLKELNLTLEEMRKKYVAFLGGAMRADKVDEYKALSEKHYNELMQFMQDENFAYSAFRYELSNYEYGYTYDEAPALRALCLTAREVSENETLRRAFVKAAADVKEATC